MLITLVRVLGASTSSAHTEFCTVLKQVISRDPPLHNRVVSVEGFSSMDSTAERARFADSDEVSEYKLIRIKLAWFESFQADIKR